MVSEKYKIKRIILFYLYVSKTKAQNVIRNMYTIHINKIKYPIYISI